MLVLNDINLILHSLINGTRNTICIDGAGLAVLASAQVVHESSQLLTEDTTHNIRTIESLLAFQQHLQYFRPQWIACECDEEVRSAKCRNDCQSLASQIAQVALTTVY